MLALVLALSMCLSLLSVNVWAADVPEEAPEATAEVSPDPEEASDPAEATPDTPADGGDGTGFDQGDTLDRVRDPQLPRRHRDRACRGLVYSVGRHHIQ